MASTTQPFPSKLIRCPACGQRTVSSSQSGCAACGFEFAGNRAGGNDITPYARAYAVGKPGWRRMSEWVWFAGSERLNHLALMRASAASRRFARWNVLLLAVGLALLQQTRVGWRRVTSSPVVEPTHSIQPEGDGWIHLSAAPRPLPRNQAAEVPVDLWWSFPQASIAIVTALFAGWLLMGLVLLLLRVGLRGVLTLPYRHEQRMTAAIHYSTAWCQPAVVGAILIGFGPIIYVGSMAQWPWVPPQRALVISGAVFAGFGFIMWWFWLVRLGAAAPPATRTRAVLFFTFAVPLFWAAASAVWWMGLGYLYDPLFAALKIAF